MNGNAITGFLLVLALTALVGFLGILTGFFLFAGFFAGT